MSKSNDLENQYLLLLFNNTNIADIGDATGLRGSTTAGSLFFSLHSADPGESGNQSTNEIALAGYSRAGKARSGSGFTVSGNAVSVVGNVNCGTISSGSATATHWGLGVASSGTGKLLYKGTISPSLAMVASTVAELQAGTVVTED